MRGEPRGVGGAGNGVGAPGEGHRERQGRGSIPVSPRGEKMAACEPSRQPGDARGGSVPPLVSGGASGLSEPHASVGTQPESALPRRRQARKARRCLPWQAKSACRGGQGGMGRRSESPAEGRRPPATCSAGCVGDERGEGAIPELPERGVFPQQVWRAHGTLCRGVPRGRQRGFPAPAVGIWFETGELMGSGC